MTADSDITRIVQLVADLSRMARRNEGPVSLPRLGERYGVAAPQIAADLRTLTLLGENAESEWLLSLSVWQQGDRVSVSSGGPFRRPLLLSPEERLALQAALALYPEGAPLARRLGQMWSRTAPDAADSSETRTAGADLIRRVRAAVREHRSLDLEYAGEGKTTSEVWRIEPHQLVDALGRTYAVSWCPAIADWRHFRLDRALRVVDTDARFSPRQDFKPVQGLADLLRARNPDRVLVRFSPRVARWVRERYPGARPTGDGSVTVTFPATSEAWLVRRVLEYGPDARVVEPARYREAVRRAVA